ncbi:MAG TPA: hypothetical protein VL576_03700 [Candidatus Paceibacterota bacterium]|jgi:hypothetical protein|nr:hypothetical protein [Candidatus Paceibacterota bacterium]
MEIVEKTLLFAGRLVLFAALSLLFIPGFLIVNYLQKPWTDLLNNLFKL